MKVFLPTKMVLEICASFRKYLFFKLLGTFMLKGYCTTHYRKGKYETNHIGSYHKK
jgi:hypothetical protein